jgi:sulfite exporter TauE/SafE
VQAFLLGLASGATCLAYCAPVLVPLVLGESRGFARSLALVAQFLGGRLIGYLLFGFLAWEAGRLASAAGAHRGLAFGVTYVLLAVFLLLYGVFRRAPACAGELPGVRARLSRWPAALPAGLGFLTGINICPPFLLAFAGAAESRSVWGSLLFFLLFFAGTSIYMLPLSLAGAFRRFQAVQRVGRLAAICMGLYYLYVGVVLIAGEVASS